MLFIFVAECVVKCGFFFPKQLLMGRRISLFFMLAVLLLVSVIEMVHFELNAFRPWITRAGEDITFVLQVLGNRSEAGVDVAGKNLGGAGDTNAGAAGI